jgi:hypothetical protein
MISLGHPAGGIWFAIGSIFLAIIFLPGVLLLTFVLPTYRSRIIAIPPLLLFIFWLISRQSHTYDSFSLPVPMLLWICTFMAMLCLFRNGRALSWQPDGFFAGKPLGIEELILPLRQFKKMPSGLVLGLDDPDVGIERDFLLQTLLDLALLDGLRR